MFIYGLIDRFGQYCMVAMYNVQLEVPIQQLYRTPKQMPYPLLPLLFLFSCLQLLTFQIAIPCPNGTGCPINSFCNPKMYCECQEGWVLDCSLKSLKLNQQFTTAQISQIPVLFTIVPSSTDAIFVYRFEMCTEARVKLNMELYADEGTQTGLEKENLIGELTLNSFTTCWPLFSPYMEFGWQKNGNIEQMVLKVKVLPSETVDQVKEMEIKGGKKDIVGQDLKTAFKIRVEEMYFLKKSTLLAIVISFVSFIGLSFILGIIYCIYAIRRGPRRFLLDNNIKYFQKLLPKQKLTATDECLAHSCSVCLLDFEQGDEVRRTPCKHTFHCQCLDIWCKKNLTCPMCRTSLSEESIKKSIKIDQMNVLLTHCSSLGSNNGNDLEIDGELLEQELRSDRKKSLREPLKINQ